MYSFAKILLFSDFYGLTAINLPSKRRFLPLFIIISFAITSKSIIFASRIILRTQKSDYRQNPNQ